MTPGCHTSSTVLNLMRRWERWPSRPSHSGIISWHPDTVGWSNQVQQMSSEGCMYTAYMPANCGINLNDVPWQWLMAPFPTSSRHVVANEVWIASIQNHTSNTENIFPLQCLWVLFFFFLGKKPQRQLGKPNRSYHPPVETSKRPRLKHPTNERNWRPHSMAALRVERNSRIRWFFMRDSRSYNGNKKQRLNHPRWRRRLSYD